jgi:hypothetical protein
VKLKAEERLILKLTFIKLGGRAWDRFMWPAFVSMVMNLRVTKCGESDKLKKQQLLKGSS